MAGEQRLRVLGEHMSIKRSDTTQTCGNYCVCQQCRGFIEFQPVDHLGCRKAPKRCPGRKKRGDTVRYVDAEECSTCTLEAMTADPDLYIEYPEFEDPPHRPMELGLWMQGMGGRPRASR
ncbi:uncharacterized protein B0H64DRAFT_371897 [Chaetomium fimeti]|uniref:Uncharacterized protein n=1 Tax=Chaetomium fimeti TaxID=1854472 RepID=A0AAE0LVY6_9PEZI|nr:hypothetical protein B0H64DRAFT_371897 [Chaetomium fimeti]